MPVSPYDQNSFMRRLPVRRPSFLGREYLKRGAAVATQLPRKRSVLSLVALGTVALLAAALEPGAAVAGPLPAPRQSASSASTKVTGSRAIPNDIPSTKTPAVDNGSVRAIARVGTSVVIGGDFTSVDGKARRHVAAFNPATGTLRSFAPAVSGPVYAIAPGPTTQTVFVAGNFRTVGSTKRRDLALLNLSSGAVVQSFHMPNTNFGQIDALIKRGNRLYLAGGFTKIGKTSRKGMAVVNAKTGKVSNYLTLAFTGHHNDTGSGAQGWVGPTSMAITPNGKRMVVIGNFTHAGGVVRDQVAMIDLNRTRARVASDWRTRRYQPICLPNSFDAYVRGLDISPDGKYFVVSSTGGPVGGKTLCDASARFPINATGSRIQPMWVAATGGDSVWGTAITSAAVFVGGHQRWFNNPDGHDDAMPGAVPRPGLAALDPLSGRPLQWNPGRNPPGKSVYAMLATSSGLYIGSNTDWIGNKEYNRPKVAFFSYSGGSTKAATSTGRLPGYVYLGGSLAAPFAPDDLARIQFDGSTASSRHEVDSGGVDWSNARGAFMVGSRVFYGATDGMLHWRSFNGTTFGKQHDVNPYHDPKWATVDNHLGGTFDGATPSLYAKFSAGSGYVTGMFYRGGKLYYTLAGDPNLYARWFSPDSGIVDEHVFTVKRSADFSDAGGMFVSGSKLYYSTRSSDSLIRVKFANGVVSGGPVLVSGPSVDGRNWQANATFLLKN
jgi:hypothetical protein